MVQVRTKKVKKEIKRFDVKDINWNKHKKKLIDVQFSQNMFPSVKTLTLDTIKEVLYTAMDTTLDAAMVYLTKHYPGYTDVSFSLSYGCIVVKAKVLESDAVFKARVERESLEKWAQDKYLRENGERIRKEEVATYERIKKKYNL